MVTIICLTEEHFFSATKLTPPMHQKFEFKNLES